MTTHVCKAFQDSNNNKRDRTEKPKDGGKSKKRKICAEKIYSSKAMKIYRNSLSSSTKTNEEEGTGESKDEGRFPTDQNDSCSDDYEAYFKKFCILT